MKMLGIDVARFLAALLVVGFIVTLGPTFALADDVMGPEQVTHADEATVHPRGLAPQTQSPQDAVIPPQPDDQDAAIPPQPDDGGSLRVQSADEPEAPVFDDLDATLRYVRERARRAWGPSTSS